MLDHVRGSNRDMVQLCARVQTAVAMVKSPVSPRAGAWCAGQEGLPSVSRQLAQGSVQHGAPLANVLCASVLQRFLQQLHLQESKFRQAAVEAYSVFYRYVYHREVRAAGQGGGLLHSLLLMMP
jgi:hypothetical protein